MEKKLSEIVNFLKGSQFIGNPETSISGIELDSRDIKEGDIFAIIKGEHFNGSEFISEAIENGARILISTKTQNSNIPQIIVSDVRDILGELSAFVYDFPSKKIPTFGITGTNGKSTTAFFTRTIFQKNGYKTGILSSAGYNLGDDKLEYSYMTTPEAPLLQKIMADAVLKGCDAFVLEISSHGFAFKRVNGTSLKGGAFTNLTRAHLDQHGDMEGYFRDKAKILDLICKDGFFVGNLDDEYSKKLIHLARKNNLNTTTYSILENKNADINGKIINETLNTLKGRVEYRGETENLEIPLAGGFNLSNALASIGIAINSGIKLKDATKALKNSPIPQGRMEFIDEGQPFTVIVDYAHSPDSFEKVLPVIKRNIPDGNRLIFVFGATGSRDIGKRPIMGEIASRYADLSVITNENPYWEKPEDIISHIEDGFTKDNYVTILDRGEAIKWAFKEAIEGDVVLIVGKGHENYICVKDKKIPFNDCDKSHSILREMGFGK